MKPLSPPCADACGAMATSRYAKYCEGCRWKHRGKPALYVWTPERDQALRERYDGRVKGRAAEIARATGWPLWIVKRRAQQLGLCYPANRKEWTPEETAFVWEHCGRRHAHWMAVKLGRSEASVVLKIRRLHISRRVREGYTLRELELCFGTDHHVIERWVREGKFVVRRREGERGERKTWYVTDTDLLAFVRDHPLSFRLDKVDQTWFMDLITSGGLISKALTDEQEIEVGE